MLFTSLGFFAFLAATLALFALVPAQRRWIVLLLAAYGFYGASKPANLGYLGAVTAVVLACVFALQRVAHAPARRAIAAAGLLAVLGSLFAFKFHDFIAGELARGLGIDLPRLGVATPVGYSFYAFSAASCLIDAYRRRLDPAPHAGHLALYVAHFPKILAGPIERATAFLPQLAAGLRPDPAKVVPACQLIGWGLVKKVVIADNLAPVVDRTFAIAAYASPIDLLVAVYFFAFQIYCDFSGYADIAIGVSLLFGLQLMENFRRPYLSRSTAEFWGERWHISLGHWFRDYLYIPLGGSRAGRLRRALNVMIVFLASGLWHAGLGYGVGWTFLVWGALNGAYQWLGMATRGFWSAIDRRRPRLGRSGAVAVLRVLFTFHLIAFAWIFFRAKSIGEAWGIVAKIGANLADVPSLVAHFPFSAEHGLGAALIALVGVVEIFDERRPIVQRLAAAPTALRWAVGYVGIFALLLLGRWQAREFIYMSF